MVELITVIAGVVGALAGVVGAAVAVMKLHRQRQTAARRKPAETAARREAGPAARREAAETAARREFDARADGVRRKMLRWWANRRLQTVALREAEKVAPDLLAKLQRSLEKSPDQRRFRVRREGGALPVSFVPHTTIIDCPPPPGDDGDLEGWVARHAADGSLFRLVSAKSSPPVYEMLEELVRHLNRRGHWSNKAIIR